MTKPDGTMADDQANNLLAKRAFREQARQRRAAVNRRDARSQRICQHLLATAAWRSARTVSVYVDFRDEVQTRWLLADALATGKRLAVPFCRPDRSLGMFSLQSLDELQPGKFGILEPPPAAQAQAERQVPPAEFDLLVIPGLAFDHDGRRLGYGQGHYDRLLPLLRPDCWKVGLAFDHQIVVQVPTEPHDVTLDAIVQEAGSFGERTIS